MELQTRMQDIELYSVNPDAGHGTTNSDAGHGKKDMELQTRIQGMEL